MSRTLVLATLACVALVAPAAVEAQGNDVNVQSGNGDIRVTVNGDPVEFTGARPMMRGGRVMVPVRGVFERLGGTVQWMPEARAVTGSGAGGANPFRMEVDSRRAFANNKDTRLDAAPRMVDGSVYVPLRFVSEALGGRVTWDNASRTVAIVPPASPARVASAAPGDDTAAAGTTSADPGAPAAASPPGPSGAQAQPAQAQPAQPAQPEQAQPAQVERQPAPVEETRQEDSSALRYLPWVLAALAIAAVLGYLALASRNRGQVIAAATKGGETGTRVDDQNKRS